MTAGLMPLQCRLCAGPGFVWGVGAKWRPPPRGRGGVLAGAVAGLFAFLRLKESARWC
jgi:hypothetical protein